MGFLAVPREGNQALHPIACPNCDRTIYISPPPPVGADPDVSLYKCSCGWESKHARAWKRVIQERVKHAENRDFERPFGR
jgi:hypothetical protein